MEEVYALKGAEVLLPGGELDQRIVCVERGKIVSVLAPDTPIEGLVYDLTGYVLSPGFIDIHVNGGGGASFESATNESIRTVIDTFVRYRDAPRWPENPMLATRRFVAPTLVDFPIASTAA